jgi:hypothetical protein
MPTNQENMEFEIKIDQQKENINLYKRMKQLIEQLVAEKNEIILAQKQGQAVQNEITLQY